MWMHLQRAFVLGWMTWEVVVTPGERPYLLTALVGFAAAAEMWQRDRLAVKARDRAAERDREGV